MRKFIPIKRSMHFGASRFSCGRRRIPSFLIGVVVLAILVLVAKPRFLSSPISSNSTQSKSPEATSPEEQFMKEKDFKYSLEIKRETFSDLTKEQQDIYTQNLKRYEDEAKKRDTPSSLRFNWGNLPPITYFGKMFDQVQNQCQVSNQKNELLKYKLYRSGMGSSIHVWSNALCEATYQGKIMVTEAVDNTGRPWEWNDAEQCGELIGKRHRDSDSTLPFSQLWCYFGQHESGERCPKGSIKSENIVDWNVEKGQSHCQKWAMKYGRPVLHGAAMEFLFQNVTDIVIEEAEAQLKEMKAVPSTSFITVNIRWGDKWKEMKLVSIQDYINATKQILTQKELDGDENVNIYIASEDPIAIEKFSQDAPTNWVIHQSGPKLSKKDEAMERIAADSGGKAGLQSLGALLISMQANRYVLSTGSNWSRLINELRKNIIDPRCGNCTTIAEFVDARRSFH
ncbi:hypothetical protein CTEN210_16071 [Chaetoceros tenuissimus]|uniref:Uncharacterized protein n=1 Tax=Chaetoceros tenuissimus TaxID=426638 RepID=A0AAD3DA43_9STRA|nr:hypothetical protein CTEN210_16071 [Chaetoceros tenuissimus]